MEGKKKPVATQDQAKRLLVTVFGSLAFLAWPATAQSIGELEAVHREDAWKWAAFSFFLALVATWLMTAATKRLDDSGLLRSRPWIFRWAVMIFVPLTGLVLVIEGAIPPMPRAIFTAMTSGFLIVGAIRFLQRPTRS